MTIEFSEEEERLITDIISLCNGKDYRMVRNVLYEVQQKIDGYAVISAQKAMEARTEEARYRKAGLHRHHHV